MHRRSFLTTLLPALGCALGAPGAGELLARAAQSHGITPALQAGAAHNAVFSFAALGDTGTGGEGQWAIARRMAELHAAQPFDTVLLLGDNLYPDGDPAGFREKFERPYAELLRRGVRFRAVLGNHDVKSGRSAQINYAPFNMGGRSYYSFAEAGGLVEFFALDSNAMDHAQTVWLEGALASSKAPWKIAFLHHPPYSSGMKHGSSRALCSLVEPLFVRHGVAAVFSGHDHVYERVRPQSGVQYFVSGAGGQADKARRLGQEQPALRGRGRPGQQLHPRRSDAGAAAVPRGGRGRSDARRRRARPEASRRGSIPTPPLPLRTQSQSRT
jgi:3',5'-cyclic AMP phosphodiesterase CpdA